MKIPPVVIHSTVPRPKTLETGVATNDLFWPDCPHCGSESLWSRYEMTTDDPAPDVFDRLLGGFVCYGCGWNGHLPEPRTVVRKE